MSTSSSSPTGIPWVALIGATPVVLVLLTWSISRQRNYHEKHQELQFLSILNRSNSLKYVAILKTILSLQLLVQFGIFIYTLLYKLLELEYGSYAVVYAIQVFALMKSFMSVCLVPFNSVSLSTDFVRYHVVLAFLLSLAVHVPSLLHQVDDFVLQPGYINMTDLASVDDTVEVRLYAYYLAVHAAFVVAAVLLILRAMAKATCVKCPMIGCESGCTCVWRNKTCACLMVICVVCTNCVYIAANLLDKFPETHQWIRQHNIDLTTAVVWAQVVEGCLIVVLLDPISQCRTSRARSPKRLLESPTSSYHLSETRIHGSRAMQGAKFPITNGSLFASLTAVAMSRPGHQNFLQGFNEKFKEEDDFDKFKTYTKDMELNDEDDDGTHSVTTIANDDFEFHHHMPPKRNQHQMGGNFHYDEAGSNSTTTTTATARQDFTDDENATIIMKKTTKKFHQKSEHIPTISLSLYESASMNDLDQVVSQSGSDGGARLYKKNARHSNQSNNNNSFNNDSSKAKNGFRRVQSCESILTAKNIERSYLDNGGFCEHYDEKVVFVTDFI